MRLQRRSPLFWPQKSRQNSCPSKTAKGWKDEGAGEWPPGFPPTGGARTESVKFGPGLKYSYGVFCLRPVRALGDAQRAEGFGGRFVVAARRLARAVKRDPAAWLEDLERNVPLSRSDPKTCWREAATGPAS
jgi:hypothetical protein